MTPRRKARPLTRAALRRTPLPKPPVDGDKENRGRVLVVGGSRLVPGSIVLAGVAALRAGAGKLQLATPRGAAVGMGLAVPEALVLPLAQNRSGEIAGARAAPALRKYISATDAILVGPGMASTPSVAALVAALVPMMNEEATLVLDGAAIVLLPGAHRERWPGVRLILTPHGGEMASLLDMDKDEVKADPAAAATRAASQFSAVVALKGAETWIADPDGTLLHYRGGSVGLGTSGSGDTLAGIIAGLAARGASPLSAAAWGVWVHGSAGEILSRRIAPVGFLARELLPEIPGLVRLR